MLARKRSFSGLVLFVALALVCCRPAWLAAAEVETLPGSEPLRLEGDIASTLVDGADRFLLDQIEASVAARAKYWQRDLTSAAAYEKSIQPNRQRLAHIVGLRDARVPFDALELDGTTARPALLAKAAGYEVYAVRWPAFGDVHGAGLLLLPAGRPPVADVVALPDCNQTPEQLVGLIPGTNPAAQYARWLVKSGCRVIVPVLINRQDKDPKLPNREWIYRPAFELGRGLIGYEVQKVLAAVDWFARQAGERPAKIGVIGWGEGGLLALYSGALDPRINAVCVSGYFDNRNTMWEGPVDRNVFGLLEQFGDAELASLIAPRTLVVEASRAPEATLPGGKGAPARVVTPALADVQREVARAERLVAGLPGSSVKLVVSGADGTGPCGTAAALDAFLSGLGVAARSSAGGEPAESTGSLQLATALPDAAARHARQLHELDRHNQWLLGESKYVREDFFWKKLDYSSLDKFAASTAPFRRIFAEEVIGRFDRPLLPAKPRTRKTEENDKWIRYEVVLDVFPDVIAYGLLTLPKNIPAGERRPVVVCQHGLEGRPQSTIGEQDHKYYKAFSTDLAEQGFVTFAPQNLYIFKDRFRTLQRKSQPLKKTLYSLITPQHQQIVDWLQTLPQVDPDKVAFYGLSYGGKTALRVPALVTDYCLSICSGDFNEWVDKNASTRGAYSYANKGEYEIFEFDLGSTFNYAEMAALIAPRPFMVERGHFDGVGVDDMVAAEYAKVRHLYAARLGIPERTEIEWFVGPHTINGKGTYAFLHRQLGK